MQELPTSSSTMILMSQALSNAAESTVIKSSKRETPVNKFIALVEYKKDPADGAGVPHEAPPLIAETSSDEGPTVT